MEKKKKKALYLIFGIILFIAFILGIYLWFSFSASKTIILGNDFISVRLYDSNGNLITPKASQSIVAGTPGVAFIDLTVTATNTGTQALTCIPSQVVPTAFNNALPKTALSVLQLGNTQGYPNKASWTSQLINVTPFESPSTPTMFNASIGCYYSTGQSNTWLKNQSGFVNLLIQSDVQGAFNVQVYYGGNQTEYCGDDVCQQSESSASCPEDCAVTATGVQFRTSDLQYPSGSSIAYNSTGVTCGTGSLIRYGAGTSGTLTGTCLANMPSNPSCPGAVRVIATLPGNITGGCTAGSNCGGGAYPSLWKSSTATLACVCDDDGSKYTYRKYDSGTSGTVDISTTTFDSSKEVAC